MADRKNRSRSSSRSRRSRQQIRRRNAVRIIVFFALVLLAIFIAFEVISGVVHTNDARLPLSSEVKSYEASIREYSNAYGISRYENLVEAVMMQESHGRGGDPMQASEGNYNTRYSNAPGSITDPYYSIDCGVHQLAEALKAAGCRGPRDMDRIKLAIQGYNFGDGYITWALENYGGYSEENAAEFSEMMAARNGSSGYGDPKYVQHVLRYYKYK